MKSDFTHAKCGSYIIVIQTTPVSQLVDKLRVTIIPMQIGIPFNTCIATLKNPVQYCKINTRKRMCKYLYYTTLLLLHILTYYINRRIL